MIHIHYIQYTCITLITLNYVRYINCITIFIIFITLITLMTLVHGTGSFARHSAGKHAHWPNSWLQQYRQVKRLVINTFTMWRNHIFQFTIKPMVIFSSANCIGKQWVKIWAVQPIAIQKAYIYFVKSIPYASTCIYF